MVRRLSFNSKSRTFQEMVLRTLSLEKRYFNSLFHRMQLPAVQQSLGISAGVFYFWRHQIYLTLSTVVSSHSVKPTDSMSFSTLATALNDAFTRTFASVETSQRCSWYTALKFQGRISHWRGVRSQKSENFNPLALFNT